MRLVARPRSSALARRQGLWGLLFISPWLFGFVHTPASLDAWMGGSILMLASAAALLVFNDWEEWLALFLGLWMIAAPWVLSFPHTATKIHLIAGFICAFLAGLELWLVHYDGPSGRSS